MQLNFRKLRLNDWKQFSDINIEFHSKLTILTGANGSGKTTILNLLAKHFGWNFSELATPARDKKTGLIQLFQRFFKSKIEKQENRIGELIYSNGTVAFLTIPDNNTAQYAIGIEGQQPIRGINIPSHRPAYSYTSINQIQTTKRTKQEAHSLVLNSSKNYLFGSGGRPSNHFLKETLLSWAMGGNGNEFIEPDPELRQNFLGFQKVLQSVLPTTLQFKELTIRSYEIVLVTGTGEFMIDSVSGGVSAIIDLAWQIYTYANKNDENLVILIDEIENHLHATMQRTILPSFISAFPNVQFIVSTHSPLVVGSVKDSNVYVFRYSSEGNVYNEKLDIVNKAKTATEILNEVLGVPFTMPVWVEHELNRIVTKYTKDGLTEHSFELMRKELAALGLEDLMPEAMTQTLRKND
jgi:predicted ATP-dependent endonuclease of OLD family